MDDQGGQEQEAEVSGHQVTTDCGEDDLYQDFKADSKAKADRLQRLRNVIHI